MKGEMNGESNEGSLGGFAYTTKATCTPVNFFDWEMRGNRNLPMGNCLFIGKSARPENELSRRYDSPNVGFCGIRGRSRVG